MNLPNAQSDICEANLKAFYVDRMVVSPSGGYSVNVHVKLWGGVIAACWSSAPGGSAVGSS